jgi:hypothetical protein
LASAVDPAERSRNPAAARPAVSLAGLEVALRLRVSLRPQQRHALVVFRRQAGQLLSGLDRLAQRFVVQLIRRHAPGALAEAGRDERCHILRASRRRDSVDGVAGVGLPPAPGMARPISSLRFIVFML